MAHNLIDQASDSWSMLPLSQPCRRCAHYVLVLLLVIAACDARAQDSVAPAQEGPHSTDEAYLSVPNPFGIWDGVFGSKWAKFMEELKPSASMVMVPPLFLDSSSVESGWPNLRRVYEEHVRLGVEFIPGNDLSHGELDMPGKKRGRESFSQRHGMASA